MDNASELRFVCEQLKKDLEELKEDHEETKKRLADKMKADDAKERKKLNGAIYFLGSVVLYFVGKTLIPLEALIFREPPQ